jgi:hypothetical protein
MLFQLASFVVNSLFRLSSLFSDPVRQNTIRNMGMQLNRQKKGYPAGRLCLLRLELVRLLPC